MIVLPTLHHLITHARQRLGTQTPLRFHINQSALLFLLRELHTIQAPSNTQPLTPNNINISSLAVLGLPVTVTEDLSPSVQLSIHQDIPTSRPSP